MKAARKDFIVLFRKNMMSKGTAEPYALVSSVSFWPVKLLVISLLCHGEERMVRAKTNGDSMQGATTE